jgi:hypothetical protein
MDYRVGCSDAKEDAPHREFFDDAAAGIFPFGTPFLRYKGGHCTLTSA